MIIKSITLENWGPFSGINKVELSDTIYAVVGNHISDEGRSNWIGKTWFLSAIRFALYGVRPDNTKNDDAWITRGTKSGSVILELDDGSVINRSRKIGSSTQLEANINGVSAIQIQGQILIDNHIGMNHIDFTASCFIRQKQISRLIVARPTDRTDIVNNWFNLGLLEKSFDVQKDKLRLLLKELNLLERSRSTLIENKEDIDIKSINKQIDNLNNQILKCNNKLSELDEELLELDKWIEHEVRAKEYNRIMEEGKGLSKILKKNKFDKGKFNKSEDKKNKAFVTYSDSKSKYLSMKDLLSGDLSFDGECPVMCNKCPVEDEVTEKVRSMETEVGIAEYDVDEKQEKYEKTKRVLSKYQKMKDKNNKMDTLREQLIKLSDSHIYIQENGHPDDPSIFRGDYNKVVEKKHELKNRQKELEQKLLNYESSKAKLNKLSKDIDKLNKKIVITHETIAIFGRNGVQRIIAESALNEIELDANLLLSNAGIDLSIEVTWSRTGRGLATVCENCGTPFPNSQKVKKCDSCHTVRGPKIINELDIIPSDRSGAADDIAGLVFQLAAAKWLRVDRGTDWGVAFIDEPFGALDKTNSTLLSNHLHSMIRNQYSFEQGFIVAHDSSIMDSLPSVIKVIGTDDGSRLEVTNG